MKTRGLVAVLLLLTGFQSALAQKLKLYLSDKQVVEYSVEKVDSLVFTEDTDNTSESHEWVDLGLPSGTLWATCNVGASSPEEYGDYFAWGETEPKSNYTWSTYKYCQGTETTMTKYCTSSSYGTVDYKTELEPSDDAATANWGSGWQMPSLEQCKELYNNNYTTTTWTVMNGIYGRMIVSKSNGNSAFLPAAGWQADAIIDGTGGYGYYWSRSLYTTSGCDHALYLDFASQYIDWASGYRYYGRTIRPVRVKSVQTVAVSNIELSQTELSVKVGETTQLSATVLPWYATNKKLKWESSNADVATVDQTGKVVAVAVGTCTITCSATDGSGVKAECKVTVLNDNSGTLDVHEYVDLGLPSGTLWATCNVGANSPEEYGDYFAWGETEPKNDYSWSTYKYYKGTDDTMTKYCTSSIDGTVDNKTELEPSDDAATANWGSGWQMPSREQRDELINSSYTITTWTTMNGKYGRKITSKSNGNSIFLPAAGYRYVTSLKYAGSYGYYWSRSLAASHSYYASSLYFYSSDIDTYLSYRYFGRSVRPVRVIAVSNIELSQTELSVKVAGSLQLSATVLPEYASNKDVKWESSNADIATVDQSGKVTAVAVGTCTVTCSATDGSGVKAECKVTVKNHEYVDLGLPSGTLWATCNVGASKPEESGDYFAWGETEPKSNYSWSTYKYCKGTNDTMTKYCTSSDYGTVDNKTELEPSDDAATANWGADWQMPSFEQCRELYNSSYTTTTWTTMNGVTGRKITSKSNGNSIFLPAAGYRSGTSLGNAGSYGRYWSRSLDTSYSNGACSLYFNSSYIYTSSGDRYYGRSVRPVRVKN